VSFLDRLTEAFAFFFAGGLAFLAPDFFELAFLVVFLTT